MIKKAVAGVIEDKKGNVFLVKRGVDARSEFGKWENCGGGVEKNETNEEAIKREVKEELGCDLVIKSVLYVDRGAEWEVVVFSIDLIGKPIVQNFNEISDAKWFKKSELDKVDLTSYTRKDFIRFGWIRE